MNTPSCEGAIGRTRRTRRTFPTIERIGNLPPYGPMLARAMAPEFPLRCFCQSAECPSGLKAMIEAQGFEGDESFGGGMLFASDAGVTLHADEKPSVLWVLGGLSSSDPGAAPTHELIVGAKSLMISAGDVVLFDARKRHGVIAAEIGRWAVFSCYVRRRRAPVLARVRT